MDDNQRYDPYDEQVLTNRLLTKYDWSDIPLQQPTTITTNPNPSLPYQNITPPKYHKLYTYFQHLKHTSELSPRVADLCQLLLLVNSSDYYALMVRANCKVDRQTDREFIDYLIVNNSKEYLLWNYRKGLMQEEKFAEEIGFLQRVLEEDMKNYHVWSYRVWLVNQTSKFEQQLTYINQKLNTNRRAFECYSVWSYRHHLIQSLKKPQDVLWLQTQITYLLQNLKQNPENQCLWNILNGYLKGSGGCQKFKGPVKNLCEGITNRFSKWTLVRIFKEEKNESQVRRLLEELREMDGTREKYWGYLLSE